MQDFNKYKQINWVDGMKISKEHFIGMENYFKSRMQGLMYRLTDKYNYGLLPGGEGPGSSVKIIPEIDNQDLKVSLPFCQAITPNGYWIDISEDVELSMTMPLSDLQEGDYFLVLSADPYTRAAVGQASTTEDPLRFPFVVADYKLQVLFAGNETGGKLSQDALIIGKLLFRDNRVELIEDYIPPCANIQSHPALVKFYENLVQSLIALESNNLELISEIHSRDSTNILTSTVLYLSDKILLFLGIHSTEYRWYLKDKPPIALVDWVVTLSKTLRNSFQTRTAEEREKLLNYFHDHFDINPSQFKQLMDHTIDIEYDHNDIQVSLQSAEEFLSVISTLFSELKKMEFIVGGKRVTKRIDIVIK